MFFCPPARSCPLQCNCPPPAGLLSSLSSSTLSCDRRPRPNPERAKEAPMMDAAASFPYYFRRDMEPALIQRRLGALLCVERWQWPASKWRLGCTSHGGQRNGRGVRGRGRAERELIEITLAWGVYYSLSQMPRCFSANARHGPAPIRRLLLIFISVSQISIMHASYLRFCTFSLFWHQRLADLQK